MKILFVASEVTPFAKTGGLADVTGSLPKILKDMEHDVRIIMPFYRMVEMSGAGIKKGRKGVEFQMGGVTHKGLLRQTSLGDIPVYLVENREYFQRDQLYGTPAGDYPDNHLRFAFFCRAVLQLLKRMDFRPDIIHCHDWQSALVPILMKYEHKEDPFFMRTACIYTIHNLAYQGIFPKETIPEMDLDPDWFTMDKLEYYGKVNLMKGAILTADVISTVSETYCREIQTPEMGCGMDGLLQQRSHDLYGIMNGLDYSEWNPATDVEITKNFTPSTLSGKGANKKRLQKVLGLDQIKDIPVLAMVTRLSAQKGLDLVEPLLPKFEAEKLQLVILGVGDEKYMQILQEYKTSAPRNISINLEFRPHLARQIYAGSDMFLMPSHYEPCGLGQLIALRYGTVPVVRKTGGLGDTVFDIRENYKEANGFTFEEYTPEAFWAAVTRALETYHEKKKWEKLVRNGMNADYSWERSAKKYDELYRKALKKIFV
jgi:starch synthase